MTVALAVTPASGSIVAAATVVRVDLTGASKLIRTRIKAECTGKPTLVSHEFQPSTDGKHSWDNLMFPDDGTWTLTAYNTATDGSLATLEVVVA